MSIEIRTKAISLSDLQDLLVAALASGDSGSLSEVIVGAKAVADGDPKDKVKGKDKEEPLSMVFDDNGVWLGELVLGDGHTIALKNAWKINNPAASYILTEDVVNIAASGELGGYTLSRRVEAVALHTAQVSVLLSRKVSAALRKAAAQADC